MIIWHSVRCQWHIGHVLRWCHGHRGTWRWHTMDNCSFISDFFTAPIRHSCVANFDCWYDLHWPKSLLTGVRVTRTTWAGSESVSNIFYWLIIDYHLYAHIITIYPGIMLNQENERVSIPMVCWSVFKIGCHQ